VYAAAVLALRAVNRRIVVGRGPDFQLGHGVLIREGVALPPAGASPTAAVDYLRDRWVRIEGHVDEVFHGRPEQLAAAYGVTKGHPYQLVEEDFGGSPVARLDRSFGLAGERLYSVLRAVGGPA
jgi:5-methylcytosine-specific restriction enzyme B